MHSQFVNRLRLLSVGSSWRHMISLVSSSLSSASVNSLLALLLFPGLLAKEDRREDFPVKQGEYWDVLIAECLFAGFGVSDSDNFLEKADTGVCGSDSVDDDCS